MNSDSTASPEKVAERKKVPERSDQNSVDLLVSHREEHPDNHSATDEDRRETVTAMESEGEPEREAGVRNTEPVSPVMQ